MMLVSLWQRFDDLMISAMLGQRWYRCPMLSLTWNVSSYDRAFSLINPNQSATTRKVRWVSNELISIWGGRLKLSLGCHWPTISPIPSAPIWLMTSSPKKGCVQSGKIHWTSRRHWLPWVSSLRQFSNQVSRYEITRSQEVTKTTPKSIFGWSK